MQANSQNYVISLSRLFSTRSNFSNAYTFNYDSFLYHYLLKKLVIYAKLSTNEAQIGDNITCVASILQQGRESLLKIKRQREPGSMQTLKDYLR